MGQGASCSTSSSVGSTHFPDDLSVGVLRQRLKERRIDTKGKKNVLIFRYNQVLLKVRIGS